MRIDKRIFLSCVTIFFACTSYAQTSTSSPYSRYGLGDLQSSIIAEYAAMGGGSIALNKPGIINPYNPASYAKFPNNRFLFSTGLAHLTMKMEKDNLFQVTNNTSLSHILLGFPIFERIGFSAGIIPYSNIGYILSNRQKLRSRTL